MSGLFGSSSSTTNTVGELKNDVSLNNVPEDSISDLAFNPNPTDQKDFLAISSWDKKVRIYEILSNGQGDPKFAYDHDGPVFSVDFFKVSRVLSPLPYPNLVPSYGFEDITALHQSH